MAEGKEPYSVPMDKQTQGDNRQHQTLQPYEEQQGDSKALTPEQHQDLIPAQAALPVSIRAENVNQGETQNDVSGDQTYIQHVDRHIERNIETNIETQVVYNIEDRTKDIPTFNLESVRNQLQQEYLETRGKLPLLPGMPEEFARMEDLFVDLHIVEEEKKPNGVISKELTTYGDIVCITQEVEKGGRNEKKEVKRVLVRGPPGVGKSTAISKLAYDWASGNQDSPILKFQLLFVITINELKSNTDLIGAIQDQLLPNVLRQGLKDYLQSNASSVAILFDGYDEASKHFHQSKDIKQVLCSKWLSEACVIVTTRPNQVGRFSQNYGPYLQIEILGFSGDERKKLYVQKFMESVQCSALEFMNRLHKSSHLTQIASIPIILSMLCLLWAEDHKLPSTVTALYREVITHLAKHSYAKTDQELDLKHIHSRIDSVLTDIGKVAIGGLFEDRLVFTSSEFNQTFLDEGCELGVVIKEKKRSRLNVTYNVAFLHKTFQEICAAHFWASLVETEQDKFQKYLEKINQGNIFEMEYLLRFACGLNMKAAEIILPHVVHIMCQHPELKDYRGKIKDIYSNPYQQLPIVLLFEAESNNSQLGHCFNLHRYLKPLITVLCIKPSWFQRGANFQEILTTYISSQQSITNERKDDSNLWFDDVEELFLEHDLIDRDTTAKLVCAMSKVTILHIKGDVIGLGNLLTNNFSGTSLSKLYLQNFECEINQFSQFLSTIPSLSKFVLGKVSLYGDFSGVVSLPTVKELQIESDLPYDCDMTSLLDVFMVNQFSGTTLSELQCKYGRFEASKFARFASCMSSLTKLTLDCVSLNGELSSAIHLPAVKELCIDGSYKACQAILYGYGQAADVIRHGQKKGHSNQESITVKTFIPVERTDITGLSHVPDGVRNLRCLVLRHGNLESSDCEQLFDILIDAAMNMHTCNHENKCTSGIGSGSGLLLEELDLSFNDIVDSVGKFAIVYGYMLHLRCLKLKWVSTKAHQWEKLFDGFIQAGRTKNYSLALEVLDLSGNQIGDSVSKLGQAYRYMKHLKCLDLYKASLDPSQCAQLFDGFISVGQSEKDPHGVQPKVLKTPSLALEELDMSRNDVGDSVGKLAQAYVYMAHLRALRLWDTKLNPSHCAMLFDGFITAGKILSQDESSSNTQGDASHIPQGGLSIEELDLSQNEIGESVDKLLEALVYMPHLKQLDLQYCKLDNKRKAKISSALKTINTTLRDKYNEDVWKVLDT